MHIEQNNNITVAYATPLTAKTNKTSIIPQRNAILTRGDLLSTSKYYKYHKAMGHTPQHIQHVAGRQRKRLLAESGLPTHMHKQIYLIQDTSIMNNKKAKRANNQKSTPSDIASPPKNTHHNIMDSHHSHWTGALPVRASSLWSDQHELTGALLWGRALVERPVSGIIHKNTQQDPTACICILLHIKGNTEN